MSEKSSLGVNKRVRATDIAADAGVSRATVGFVLNSTPGQTISEATRQRVLESAARLKYRPHTAARALASGKSMLVLYVLPDWPLDFSMRRHLEAASEAIEAAGYSLVTYTPHGPKTTKPLWETLAPDIVIGSSPFSSDDLRSLRASGVRHIVPEPGSVIPDPGTQPYGKGPDLQIQHLVDLGHRNIGYATTSDPRLRSFLAERVAVAQKAAIRLGVAPLHVQSMDDPQVAIDQWRENGVTGVAAYNDEIAIGVVGAAQRAGLTVPADLSVVGHDDIPLASSIFPAVSTIAVDNASIGRQLAALALSQATGESVPSLPDDTAQLIRRESSTTVTAVEPTR